MVEVTGFEPAASTSRTWRSTKLSHTSISFKKRTHNRRQSPYCELMVEVTGLEPAASCSQSRHSSQTELHLDMIIKFLRSCSVVLWSPSCKIVALYTAVSIALFCCASSSSLYLPPAAVAFVTQSRHSSQTELHLEVY